MIGVIAMLSSAVVAQNASTPERAQNGKRSMHKELLNDIPDLTEEQKAQIEEIHKSAKEGMKAQREESKEIRMKIMELKTAENPDQAQINKLIDRQSAIKADMMKQRTAAELKVRSILTPEQRKVLDAKMKEQGEKRQKRQQQRKMEDAK